MPRSYLMADFDEKGRIKNLVQEDIESPEVMLGVNRGGSRVFAAPCDSRQQQIYVTPLTWYSRTGAFWLTRLSAKLGASLSVVGPHGIAGQSAAQFNAAPDYRITQCAADHTITDVVLQGFVNGIALGYSGQSEAEILLDYADTLVAAGKTVWLCTDPGAEQGWLKTIGTAGNPTWTNDNSKEMGRANRVLREGAKARRGVVLLDIAAWVTRKDTATNSLLAGYVWDGVHPSVGGADYVAEKVIEHHGNLLPRRSGQSSGVLDLYSGDPADPVQLLDNPGWATLGGTLGGTQAAAPTAWGAAAAVTVGLWRQTGNRLYYYTKEGNTGATAPTHLAGDVADGTAIARYVCSNLGQLPQYWLTSTTAGASYWCGTVDKADGSRDLVVVSFFAALDDQVRIRCGTDGIGAGFTGRFALGKTYSIEGSFKRVFDSAYGNVFLRWDRGDMANVPGDGVSDATGNSMQSIITNKNTNASQLVAAGYTETRVTPAFTAEHQSTPGSIALPWSQAQWRIQGAGAGFMVTQFQPVSWRPVD